MGEWSKKIGEYGEEVVNTFLSAIGWNDLVKGQTVICLNKTHLNEKENKKKTHGVDFLFAYNSPLVSGQTNNILISYKYTLDKYPNSPNATFKSHMQDLIETLECYAMSDLKRSTNFSFNSSSVCDIGLLFWLSNNKDSVDDLISIVAQARGLEINPKNFIVLMDNKRVAFLLGLMSFIKSKEQKFLYNFYYHNTGRNLNPVTKFNEGKILPIEFLNSPVIPVKLVNRDNEKEVIMLIASSDNYDKLDLLRLMGFAKDITTNLVGDIIISFPDYDKFRNEAEVQSIKQNFQDGEFTRKVRVINLSDSTIQI